MTFTDLVYATSDFLEAILSILPTLGNIPNYIFIGVGAIGFLFWLNLQIKYNKNAKKAGTRQ